MSTKSFQYVVEFEKKVDKRFEITQKHRVFFTTLSNAVDWVKLIERFDNNQTYKKFSIKELEYV